MDRRLTNKLIVVIVIMTVFLIGQLVWLLTKDTLPTITNLTISQKQSKNIITGTKEEYDRVFDSAARFADTPIAKIGGGILPHHLLVKEQIASYLLGLADQKYDTVVIIGPNHQNIGHGDIIYSDANWQTPTGSMDVDLNSANLINSTAKLNNKIIQQESSITVLLPYIHYALPKVKILPLIIKESAKTDELAKIAQLLSQYCQEQKILVLASIDFSHYLPVDVADFHDQITANIIQTFDQERILQTEIDSPKSAYLLLEYLRLTQQQKSFLVRQTNSGRFLPQQSESTTSHQFYYFVNGEPQQEKYLALMFFGDLMLDRNVKKQYENKNLDVIFQGLSGQENRFWRGLDLTSANLEGAVLKNGEHWLPDNAYDFSFDLNDVGQLKKYNFNFFNLANNHLTDQGTLGVEQTRDNLKQLNLEFSGCADAQIGECSLNIINRRGYRLAMLGFSQVYQPLDLGKIQEMIKQVKDKSDVIIINIHWGNEYQHQKNTIQENIAHTLIDSGADLIIGHHPHVVQGKEKYRGKYIFYSLGNFVFDQYFSADTQEGLGLGLIMDPSATNKILDYYLFPLQSERSRVRLMSREKKQEFVEKFDKW